MFSAPLVEAVVKVSGTSQGHQITARRGPTQPEVRL